MTDRTVARQAAEIGRLDDEIVMLRTRICELLRLQQRIVAFVDGIDQQAWTSTEIGLWTELRYLTLVGASHD